MPVLISRDAKPKKKKKMKTAPEQEIEMHFLIEYSMGGELLYYQCYILATLRVKCPFHGPVFRPHYNLYHCYLAEVCLKF